MNDWTEKDVENLIRGSAFLNPGFKASLRKRLFDKTRQENKPMSEKEEEVFSQKIDEDDIDAVAGGCGGCINTEVDCVNLNERDIYKGGFPNCAATVEDGSLCNSNDACLNLAVDYKGMKDCHRAWR